MNPTLRRTRPRAFIRYLKNNNNSVHIISCFLGNTSFFVQSKNSRPLRTCQIYTQDDNATQIQLYNNRFELMKIIASKRSPPIKPLYVQAVSNTNIAFTFWQNAFIKAKNNFLVFLFLDWA